MAAHVPGTNVPIDSWTIDDQDVVSAADPRPLHQRLLGGLADLLAATKPHGCALDAALHGARPRVLVSGPDGSPLLLAGVSVEAAFAAPPVPVPHLWLIGLLPLGLAVYRHDSQDEGEYLLVAGPSREVSVAQPWPMSFSLAELARP